MVELAEDEEQVDPIANIVYLIDYRETIDRKRSTQLSKGRIAVTL